MIKQLLLCIMFCTISLSYYSQRKFEKSKMNKNEKLIVRNDGIQWSFGPTYQLTKKRSDWKQGSFPDYTGQYATSPTGGIGFFTEIGMAHFPKWTPFFSNRILDYLDWGIGFKSLAGKEETLPDETSSLSRLGLGEYRNGFLTARISAHTLIYVGKKKIDLAKKYFIDNGIGIDFGYNLWGRNQDYSGQYNAVDQRFYPKFSMQIHYNIACGIRFNRALMCLPGIQLPILGISQWNGLGANMNWFSSKYWPIQFNIKFIRLLEKKPNCAPVYNNSFERQKMRDMME